MTGFSNDAWLHTAALRAAIHGLPFNQELAAGTLSRERFAFYITQDALYLEQYARILALAGARGPDIATLRLFAGSAVGAVAVEQALHNTYMDELGIGSEFVTEREQSPDCLAYTSFLMATAYQEPWEVLIAALLPCFWIYRDVGSTISRNASPGNPYYAWIETYADEAFSQAVDAVIRATDLAAEQATSHTKNRMMKAFARCTQYELLFWDGAYSLRSWPPS